MAACHSGCGNRRLKIMRRRISRAKKMKSKCGESLVPRILSRAKRAKSSSSCTKIISTLARACGSCQSMREALASKAAPIAAERSAGEASRRLFSTPYLRARRAAILSEAGGMALSAFISGGRRSSKPMIKHSSLAPRQSSMAVAECCMLCAQLRAIGIGRNMRPA